MKNIITLAVIVGVLFFLYRSCTKGYDQYAYFVKVQDETVFEKVLSNNDPRIVDHGRTLKTNVLRMDQETDNGDGAEKGRLRWYVCSGIDCDEGWQRSFTRTLQP